jgi:hypothetical protein
VLASLLRVLCCLSCKASVNKDTVDGGIKAVKTRKARYALFKVVNEEGGALQITLDKQAERKASKEDFFKDLSESHCTPHGWCKCDGARVTDLSVHRGHCCVIEL